MRCILSLGILFFAMGSLAQSIQVHQKLIASGRDTGDFLGAAIDISADYAIIGSVGDKDSVFAQDTLTRAGPVFVFKRDNSGGWRQHQKIGISDRETQDSFGNAVDIDGSGIIVDAYFEDQDLNGGNFYEAAGAVYVCTYPLSSLFVSCDSFIAPSGTILYSSGSYVGTVMSSSGRDSLMHINLLVDYSVSTTDLITVGSSYTWVDGNTYVQSNGSITNDEQELELHRLKLSSSFDEKEASLVLKGFKYKGLILGLLATNLAGGIILLIYLKNQKQAAVLKEIQVEKDILNFKLMALRSKLNPHFIFNALVSLEKSISVDGMGMEKARAYLTEFAKLMRAFLEHSEPGWITLENELKIIENYINIELLRFDNKFLYSIEVPEKIDTSNVLVPALYLQPIVENSIQHGLPQSHTQGKLHISISLENGDVVTRVMDNGIEKTGNTLAHKQSLGLKLVRETIDVLTNNQGQLEGQRNNNAKGYVTTVRFPLNNKF